MFDVPVGQTEQRNLSQVQVNITDSQRAEKCSASDLSNGKINKERPSEATGRAGYGGSGLGSVARLKRPNLIPSHKKVSQLELDAAATIRPLSHNALNTRLSLATA